MSLALRTAVLDAIRSNPEHTQVISKIDMAPDGTGHLVYAPTGVWVDPSAPGFAGAKAPLTDEEVVRAYFLTRLVSAHGYRPGPDVLEIERVYKSVGHSGKGGRIDILVRKAATSKGASGDAFLFVEVKSPTAYDRDLDELDGQLFRLSQQELPRPRYLLYYTVDLRTAGLFERMILIDTAAYGDHAAWTRAGQPIIDEVPERYNAPKKRLFANVPASDKKHRSLDRGATAETFNRIRTEIHDVIWGGGGTNNNEVFVYVTKLILCKIYDEKETAPGAKYRFQRLGDANNPELPVDLSRRMNTLYKEAEDRYLALSHPSEGPAFDANRISPDKLAYVVGRLEGLAITDNTHSGDLLGEFFEQIVEQDFTQTKGQFFSPSTIVRFMLQLASAAELAKSTMLTERDHLGRPRLPYVIDPSCGSGTFLIEYMKLIREELTASPVAARLPARLAESHTVWFAPPNRMGWAREFLFAVENNYDLGIAAKVNMVLHGDGSMNTWIRSALLPFQDYWVTGRHNLLGVSLPKSSHPYAADRNEQFDLVVSNPPFSIRMSPDEKSRVQSAFSALSVGASEAIFIERWYQLLREGGKFCCVLPEAILDTKNNSDVRAFLLQYFKIEAIVSLPYDAFRPFTSTKTCVVLATKRSATEAARCAAELKKAAADSPGASLDVILRTAVLNLGWQTEAIFMAEPQQVGYKRRKNLADLTARNDLYPETPSHPDGRKDAVGSTVLDRYRAGPATAPDAALGFWTSLGAVLGRGGVRLDPKYRWLWDFQDGVVHGRAKSAVALRDILKVVDLPKVKKGELADEAELIDLEHVESRQGFLSPNVGVVDEIGSDKVKFEGCELIFSKLEPYLGKVLPSPPPGALGSTEWVGLTRLSDAVPLNVIAYLLMLPDLCEGYRRLQSGKRHARLSPDEMLDLKVELPAPSKYASLEHELEVRRQEILAARAQVKIVRQAMDRLFD
jgi:type I restriction enzyme M protein